MRRLQFLVLALVSCSPAAPEPQTQPATVVPVTPPPAAEATEPGRVEEPAPLPSHSPEPVSADSRAQAEAAFQKARRLFAQGQYPEACALFEESVRYDPAVGTYMNLGRCRELEGNVPAACQAYGEGLRMSPTGERAKFTVAAMQKLGCNVP